MSLERNPKFKLKKKLRDPEIAAGTEGFILREPDTVNESYGVRICGVDLDLKPDFVELESVAAA